MYMSMLPFSITPEATAWIVEKLQWAEAEPAVVGLVPALCFALNYQNRDEKGQIVEWCPHSFFDIGWFSPEVVAIEHFLEIYINGLKLFCQAGTLERLQGKQLMLDTVEVGYPIPSDAKRQLLRIAPSE
jgi:hypothetical protein